jgi:rare lipoprotein A
MADGKPMNPESNVAASKNLPLGTTAKVTNLQNGRTSRSKTAAPTPGGRVIDVSPAVSDQLDLKKEGTAPVEVKPITVPHPDGAIKLGAGGAERTPTEVTQATETTKQITGAPAAATTGH